MKEASEVKRKQSDVATFLIATGLYRYQKDKDGNEVKNPPIRDKFDYALDRTSVIVRKAIEESNIERDFFKKKEEAEIDEALTDSETGRLLKDEDGNYQYSAEGEKRKRVKIRKAEDELRNKEIKFVPYMAKMIPVLSVEQIEAFRGFVLPEDYELPEPGDGLSASKNGLLSESLTV